MLQVNVQAELQQKLGEITALWQLVKTGGKQAADAASKLLQQLHHLAGSEASFGQPRLSDVARSLEQVLLESGGRSKKEVDQLVAEGLSQLLEISRQPLVGYLPVTGAKNRPADARRLIYLVDDDKALGQDLAAQIHFFGFDVRGFTRIEDMLRVFDAVVPTAIIMDMAFPEGKYAGAAAVKLIRGRAQGTRVPVIYLTSHADFQSRLEAARAGCDGYFVKPADVGLLIDRLDTLLARGDSEPYRVLIVDDMVSMAQYNAIILQQGGMETAIISDPAGALEMLDDFNPELILMDMYMPECSGDELAQVIRQRPEFISIPIVYLSAEQDRQKQLLAMSHGGDDFLTKPINPEHLVASVTIRAERYRDLRSLMVRDGLTGLLNHSRIEEELDLEISRASRESKSFAFVMIDLDHFKSVNDNYGHQVGDHVLQSLARLLRERLRKVDRIGRYGGEEFAVILPNVSRSQAVKVIDVVREAFSRIVHHSNDGREFSVTMSCGIAGFESGEKMGEIERMADEALYEAKHAGRNRVAVKK